MVIKFRKKAIKFLEKINHDDVENIREQIKQILIAVEDQGIIPFTELDIKKMKVGLTHCTKRLSCVLT